MNLTNQNLTKSVANWGDNTMLYNDEDVDWIMTFHQLLLFIIVLGRWVLPRGDISRDELSQLLLIFIGTGNGLVIRIFQIHFEVKLGQGSFQGHIFE